LNREIASRQAHSLQADIWSLGCMMYTFLAGKPPFDTKGVKNTLNRVVNDNYDIPKHISNEAKDLISGLLQKKPEDRIPLESRISFYSLL
jgi:polo-like kinase 4